MVARGGKQQNGGRSTRRSEQELGPARRGRQRQFLAPAGHLVALLGPFRLRQIDTLRLIAGLETASAGTIRIANREVTALPPAKRGVSMVFQNYALFPHLSVAENILFGLKVRDVPKAERTERLNRAAGISASRRCWSASPRSSPAGSSSAWHSAAPSWRRPVSA
jgi:sn-glycerol 3-phosphate transport system ATP-binding protein